MPTPKLTEATIGMLASAQSFRRGKEYYESGAVTDLVRRGNTLRAQVEGSQYEPYTVTLELDAGGVVDATCTCPYDYEDYCKHIVAVLLVYVRQPDRVAERRPVSELLAGLRQDQLLDLLTKLLSAHPDLADWVEVQLAAQPEPSAPSASDKARQRHTPIDPTSFRRQVHNIMSSLSRMRLSEAYWATGGMVNEIRNLLNQAQPFIEAGDGRNALLILEAVTEVYVDRWTEFDDSNGELGGLFAKIGPLFAEAILGADLSPTERKKWAERLTDWQGEVEDYGIDEAFDVAIAAATQGWDYPPLQRVLQGHLTNKGAWEGEAPWYADELAVARLNVLEQQGKTTEYLNLAEAEGQTDKYVTMLVKVGRSQEAIEYGLKHLATPGDALALAQALREHNRPLDALKMAEYGLTLQGDTFALACWLRELASGLGQSEAALKAARAAFAQSLTLEDYQAAQTIAVADWPSIKAELLELLDAASYASGKIDIYLHEGMIEKAVKAIDKSSYFGYETLERVVEAAWHSHPDWVIRQCKKQAESIMDRGKSEYYRHAVQWLEKARQAYLASDQASTWRTYLEGLIKKHARKYSLRPQLEALRK
ncbi:MAG: SWIM zinc finger domain-containing protein [Acidobacteria bacterium]|nr:SWIM zinc finger domain-containing protein [Acidobacteriota bacterium]